MTTDRTPSVVVLSRALDQAGDAIAAVRLHQLSDPTPCPEWDVRRLVQHLCADVDRYVQAARGGSPDWSTDPEPPEHPVTTFRSHADDLIHLWHQAGASADEGTIDFQTAELAVHTWDLARATGQNRHLDPEIAERGLGFLQVGLTAENRAPAFGPPVDVSSDAPVYDRLAAFAGRDPGA